MTRAMHTDRARWRHISTWSAGVIALAAAVMTVPPVLAEWSFAGRISVSSLPETVSTGFDQWIAAGSAAPSAVLTDAATFWAIFHVTKAVLASALLWALIVVGYRIWVRAARSETRAEHRAWTIVGVLGAWLPVLVLLVVLANIQGAVAPLSSVMSFLPIRATTAIGLVRTELASGTYGPATSTLLGDFRMYHAVLAGSLLIVATALLATITLMLIRRARLPGNDRFARRVLACGAVALTLLTAALGLLLLANLSTVADTATALAGFFNNGGS